jgi:hypothetical protein
MEKWQSIATQCRQGERRLMALEAKYAGRETRRRTDLIHALFHLGKKIDCRRKRQKRDGIQSTISHQVGKALYRNRLSLDGVETSAEDAAVAASKGKCNKRDRFPYPRRTINITFVTPCYSPNWKKEGSTWMILKKSAISSNTVPSQVKLWRWLQMV